MTPFGQSKPPIYLGRARRESLHAQAPHRAGDGLASGHRVNLLERYDCPNDAARLAATIKALPLVLGAPRPVDEAISSAGGVAWDAVDDRLMLKALPGVFCAGEMLDWEAPTGGYLLAASFATGRQAGLGALRWLGQRAPGGAGAA